MNTLSLIRKYNIPGPRYTSYPTVPMWNKEGIDKVDWLNSVQRSFDESNHSEGISLYIHLPFCENLCTFCGCHKRITKKHSFESPYIKAVLNEWRLYLSYFKEVPKIKEIHLGGGTPTFFSPDNLKFLINGILDKVSVTEEYEFGFEGHPNNTTKEHLKVLYDLGFRRCSFGVQDYDPVVQKVINRIQPFENVKLATDLAREIGFTSISHDLVFGLPKQTMQKVESTIQKTCELLPDRIAYYSYAHVPWIKGLGQRGFDESDLPKDEEKRQLYDRGKKLLSDIGYHEIGMDHFALSHDQLYRSMKSKTLHRNFMGYTSGKTQLMLGLGMSSISDSWYAFAQNNKSLEEYKYLISRNEIPVFRGHLLTGEDLIIRKHILNIMCHFQTSWKEQSMQFPEMSDVLGRLKEMESDGLVIISNDVLKVPDHARPYIRNICMAFDLRLLRTDTKKRIFSMTI